MLMFIINSNINSMSVNIRYYLESSHKEACQCSMNSPSGKVWSHRGEDRSWQVFTRSKDIDLEVITFS